MTPSRPVLNVLTYSRAALVSCNAELRAMTMPHRPPFGATAHVLVPIIQLARFTDKTKAIGRWVNEVKLPRAGLN